MHIVLGKSKTSWCAFVYFSVQNCMQYNSAGLLFPAFVWKVCLVKAIVFPVVMSGCESWNIKKAEWVLKNWCFLTVVLEKTFESPLDCKKIQPVHSEGDQSWDFFGGNDAEAETPVLWPPRVKSWLTGKDSDAGRDLGKEEKGMTEDELARWHHWLDGYESE